MGGCKKKSLFNLFKCLHTRERVNVQRSMLHSALFLLKNVSHLVLFNYLIDHGSSLSLSLSLSFSPISLLPNIITSVQTFVRLEMACFFFILSPTFEFHAHVSSSSSCFKHQVLFLQRIDKRGFPGSRLGRVVLVSSTVTTSCNCKYAYYGYQLLMV